MPCILLHTGDDTVLNRTDRELERESQVNRQLKQCDGVEEGVLGC